MQVLQRRASENVVDGSRRFQPSRAAQAYLPTPEAMEVRSEGEQVFLDTLDITIIKSKDAAVP